jgi:iron complex outermembrane receptor protein
VSQKDIEKTNAVAASDTIKYESGVVVHQRYIGNLNMVMMDGMPIWNSLQYSFNGSPCWGLVGSGDVKSIYRFLYK